MKALIGKNSVTLISNGKAEDQVKLGKWAFELYQKLNCKFEDKSIAYSVTRNIDAHFEKIVLIDIIDYLMLDISFYLKMTKDNVK